MTNGSAPAPSAAATTAAATARGSADDASFSFSISRRSDENNGDDDDAASHESEDIDAFRPPSTSRPAPPPPIRTASATTTPGGLQRLHSTPTLASEAPTAVSRQRSRDSLDPHHHPSHHHAPIGVEDYVAKYQVIKCSWRGKYERLLALGPTRFCTIDPKDFEVTNTWPLTALLGVTLDPTDNEGFALGLRGAKKDEQLKLRCRFRSRLLSDLFAQQERHARPSRATSGRSMAPCAKWSRRGLRLDGSLVVNTDGLAFLASSPAADGAVRSSYLYVEMEHVSAATDAGDALIIGYRGRPRIFFSERRHALIGQITAAAENLGLQLPSRVGTTIAGAMTERKAYGTNVGEPFVRFDVEKITPKYPAPVERTLSLHQKHLVELDSEGLVVSCVRYNQIYVLVRAATSPVHFDIQFLDGSSTRYTSRDRDGVLAAIYDLCVTCNENPELFITSAPNERGLRLLPCFATEDAAESSSFFGETSIGICFLQRMTAVGRIGGGRKGTTDRAFIEIVEEFNANVPASGILYDTKQPIISEALRSIGPQLYYLTRGTPIPCRSAVTLLQALFRIASSYYGFREVAQVQQLTDSIANLLAHGDEFAVFWTTMLLRRITTHSTSPNVKLDAAALRSCEDVEAQNKSILFGNSYLIQSLVGHLSGVDIRGADHPSPGQSRPRVGPLVVMGVLQTLEASLCSRKHTTAPAEYQKIVAEMAKHYSTLLKVLFQSRCATTVEACTLLLKTTLEECEPTMAQEIRDAAMAEGIVLRHFYQAIFDPSFDQRSVSRYLISLWMSHHTPSRELLARMIPSGFLAFLEAPKSSAAEIREQEQLEMEQGVASTVEEPRVSFLPDEPPGENEVWPAESSRRGSVSTTFDSQPSQLFSTASARGSLVVQIENDYTKARMLQKLQHSVRSNTAGTTLRESSTASGRGSDGEANSLPHRVRKRDIAFGYIVNAVSKAKSESQHPSKMKRTTSKILSANDNREPENFRLMFFMMAGDHERIDLIWNQKTRGELKKALSHEIEQFGLHQNNVGSGKAVWNFDDFRVTYSSLADEPCVGGCYLRVLADTPLRLNLDWSVLSNEWKILPGRGGDEDQFFRLEPEDLNIRDPKSLIAFLYRRVLRENVRAEHHDETKLTLLCIQAIVLVSGAYCGNPTSTVLDEIDHLVQLVRDTVHVPVIEMLLHALRALTLSRLNAKNLAEHEDVYGVLVNLLQMGHVCDRADSITTPRGVWVVKSSEKAHGPMDVEGIITLVHSGQLDPRSCIVERVDDETSEPPFEYSLHMLRHWQLRWEAGIAGQMHHLQVAHDAINILLSLVHSNTLLHSKAEIAQQGTMFPVLRAKVLAWRHVRAVLPFLCRYNFPRLAEKAAKLLNFLYEPSGVAHFSPTESTNRPSLRAWGLFYMAFVVDTLNFEDFAGLLKSTHLFQFGLDGISALIEILPEAMIDLLERASAQEFAQVFNGSIESPRVIWSREMRLHLRENCLSHLTDYLEVLQEDVSSNWRYCPMAPVTYEELEKEVWCGGVYLGKFCEQTEFLINDPLEFMALLTRKWREEVDRREALVSYEKAADILGVPFTSTARDQHNVYRIGFKRRARELQNEPNLDREAYSRRLSDIREAYRVVTAPRHSLLTCGHDPVNLLLILNSLVEMCSRYPGDLQDYIFDSYDLLLPLLDSHCTADGIVPGDTSTDQRYNIAVCSAELLYNTCAVSYRNGDMLLAQAGLEVLERVVNFCLNEMIGNHQEHDVRVEKVCFFVLQTVTGLLASQTGRLWISQSKTLLVDMIRVLWFWNHAKTRTFLLSKTTQQVLESLSRMAILPENQNQLLAKGVLWQLLPLLNSYNVDLDDATVYNRLRASIRCEDDFDVIAEEIGNLLGIMSVRALCRIGGMFAPESDLASPKNQALETIMNSLFTPNLAKLLELDSHHDFLKLYHGECTSHTLFWNHAMREELSEFTMPRMSVEPSSRTEETYDDAVKFRFEFLARVFKCGDIYVDSLIDQLQHLRHEQSEKGGQSSSLNLPDRFFPDLFAFIEDGTLLKHTLVAANGEIVEQELFAGWKYDRNDFESTLRLTAVQCVALASEVVPTLVERHTIQDTSTIKLLLRLLFPPDNDVHQGDNGEGSLVFSEELYTASRHYCLTALQALSTLDAFGKASYEVGICDILIEVVHTCLDIGAAVLVIIYNLCRAGGRADFVTDILQTGTYLEFIGWFIGVEDIASGDRMQLAESLRVPCAMVLGELGRPGGALSVESLAVLHRFFPVPLADHLIESPRTFVDVYQADHENPELVWNADMRTHLRFHVINTLNEYYNAPSPSEDGGDITGTQSFHAAPIDYVGIYPHPMVGNVYLNLYIENPTFQLRDPLFFVTSLWSEFEIFYQELAHLSSSLRQTQSPDDDMMAQQGEQLLDLVTACMVCAMRANPWLPDAVADSTIPEKCCSLFSESVRNGSSESCIIAVVRLLRILSTSKKCVALMQPVSSNLISSLFSRLNPVYGGVLHKEAAFTLEIVRRVVANFPTTIANGEGIVTVAMRVDMFSFLLNIVENGMRGPVRQPQLTRAIAIDILNMLEKDRLQARAAHEILKKNKKWEKKYRHEGQPIPVPGNPEDPFLQNFSQDLDRQLSQYSLTAPKVRPASVRANGTMMSQATLPLRGTIIQQFRNSPRQRDSSLLERPPSSGATKKGLNYRKLFSRRE